MPSLQRPGIDAPAPSGGAVALSRATRHADLVLGFTLKRMLLAFGILLPAVSTASPSVEAGSSLYRVQISGSDHPLEEGDFALSTGPDHVVTAAIGRQGDLIGGTRSCPGCPAYGDTAFTSVHSYSTDTTYRMGDCTRAILAADPGTTCLRASDLSPALIEGVIVDGVERGVRASWLIAHAVDSLELALEVVVLGDGLVDGFMEVTTSVRNAGTEPAAVGIRALLPIRMTLPAGNAISRWRVHAMSSAGESQLVASEAAWSPPDGLAFVQLNPHGLVFPDFPHIYHVGCRLAPSAASPQVVEPEWLQAARSSKDGGVSTQPEGVYDSCFRFEIPDPPRPLRDADQGVIAPTWGATEETAIWLAPGEEFRATQHLVAYQEFPLRVEVDGPWVAPCAGLVTAVDISGVGVPLEPTSATLHHRWFSSDPRVSFVDAAAAATQALLPGPGTYPVSMSVSVGAYEAWAHSEVIIEDVTPPRIESLAVRPGSLWPPNHRLVPVHIQAIVTDDCGGSPSLRLIEASSSEPDDRRGDGATTGDVARAVIGTDDRDVQLRAERSGRGAGRRYTLVYEATDAAGNTSTRSVVVPVGHDRSGRR